MKRSEAKRPVLGGRDAEESDGTPPSACAGAVDGGDEFEHLRMANRGLHCQAEWGEHPLEGESLREHEVG